MIIRNKR